MYQKTMIKQWLEKTYNVNHFQVSTMSNAKRALMVMIECLKSHKQESEIT